MKEQKTILKRKQLAVAVSMAILTGAITGCSSSSSDPAPAPGTATIVSNGGLGGSITNSRGGYGGHIYLNNNGGSGGVEIRSTGAANTDFTTPAQITADATAAADLGDNPLAVIADLILQVVAMNNGDGYADGTGLFTAGDLYAGDDDVIRASALDGPAVFASDATLAADTYYMRDWESNSRRVYMSTSGVLTAHTVITGISVAEGTTLTLGENNGCSSSVEVTNDIDNSGTITKEMLSEGCSIDLGANRYKASGSIVNAGSEAFERGGMVMINTATGIANNGPINTSGFNEDNDVDELGAVIGDEDGGDGGEIILRAAGYNINSGALDTSGGDGRGAGGDGGEVRMNGAYTENNGALNTTGGSNVSDPAALTFGNGGEGGYVTMNSDYVTNNTADIDTSGGTGSAGGTGNYIQMDNDLVGEVKNAGNLSMNGGVGLEGYGAEGGDLRMMAYGGNLLNSGNVTSIGGNSTDAAGYGAVGGDIYLNGYGGEGDKAPGDIVVSGNINLSGGDATADGTGSGGNGGELSAQLNMNDMVAAQRVSLLGYASVDVNGGDGAEANNSDGGSVNLNASYYENNDQVVFAGSAVNNVPINARGGNSTATVEDNSNDGGDGGQVTISASTSDDVSKLNVTATNTAAIDVSAGNGFGADNTFDSRGGVGGRFNARAYHGADNSGALTMNGGNGGSDGGEGGFVNIDAVVGAANNSGAIASNGGTGYDNGGGGGNVFVFGASGANSGDIGVNGGNATETDDLVESYGGWGGEVGIFGLGLDAPATNTGSVTYSFGTGDINGEDGCLAVGLTFEGNCN